MAQTAARLTAILLLLLGGVHFVGCSSEVPRGREQEQRVSKYEGKLVKRPGTSSLEENKVYIVKEGKKHWIQSPAWITGNGYKFDDIKVIPASELESIPNGEDIK